MSNLDPSDPKDQKLTYDPWNKVNYWNIWLNKTYMYSLAGMWSIMEMIMAVCGADQTLDPSGKDTVVIHNGY